MNLGLAAFDLNIMVYQEGFRYEITFRFAHTRQSHSDSGTAPSPGECYDKAMAFFAHMMREAVAE